jgi:hypothetical protein
MAPAVATYVPQDPSQTVLYHVIAEHLETFLASLGDDSETTGLAAYVEREFYDYLRCGILAHGFLRLGCDTCKKDLLVPFSCKRRGFCPSCAGRRMAQTAAHRVDAGSALGADPPMGRLGPRPLTVLDGGVVGPYGQGPYDHS